MPHGWALNTFLPLGPYPFLFLKKKLVHPVQEHGEQGCANKDESEGQGAVQIEIHFGRAVMLYEDHGNALNHVYAEGMLSEPSEDLVVKRKLHRKEDPTKSENGVFEYSDLDVVIHQVGGTGQSEKPHGNDDGKIAKSIALHKHTLDAFLVLGVIKTQAEAKRRIVPPAGEAGSSGINDIPHREGGDQQEGKTVVPLADLQANEGKHVQKQHCENEPIGVFKRGQADHGVDKSGEADLLSEDHGA